MVRSNVESVWFLLNGLKHAKPLVWSYKKSLAGYVKEPQGSGVLSCRAATPPGDTARHFLPTGTNGQCNFLLAHKQTMQSTEVRLKILQCHLERSRGIHQSYFFPCDSYTAVLFGCTASGTASLTTNKTNSFHFLCDDSSVKVMKTKWEM